MKKSKQTKIKVKPNDYKEDLQRLHAEFENYVKRVEKEKIDLRKFAPQDILLKLLNIQDNFERALNSIETTKNNNKIKDGIKMIFNQVKETLTESHVTPMDVVGKKFDPYFHEVIQKVPSNESDNQIIEEIQKGYMLHDKVLRHSKVKITEIKLEDKKINQT